MADVSIQFHATPEEMCDFVKEVVSEFGLHVVAIQFPPYKTIEIDYEELEGVFRDTSPFDELAFTLHPPAIPKKSNMDMADMNPDALWLATGKKTKSDLGESHLSARTEDATAIHVWKKIARRLRDMTEKGALAVNPDTGAAGPAPWHRYTAGAKALEASGVQMLTITGIILKLGQTADKNEASAESVGRRKTGGKGK